MSPRPPRPNQQQRAHRRAIIDTLLIRALRGVLTIPEAAVLADSVRTERRLTDVTRQRLTETTRALQRNRDAADAAIREAEQRAERAEAKLDLARRACEAVINGGSFADAIAILDTVKETGTP